MRDLFYAFTIFLLTLGPIKVVAPFFLITHRNNQRTILLFRTQEHYRRDFNRIVHCGRGRFNNARLGAFISTGGSRCSADNRSTPSLAHHSLNILA